MVITYPGMQVSETESYRDNKERDYGRVVEFNETEFMDKDLLWLLKNSDITGK